MLDVEGLLNIEMGEFIVEKIKEVKYDLKGMKAVENTIEGST